MADEHEAVRQAAIANLRKNARPPQPLTLGDAKSENWKTFKERWDNYVLLSQLNEIPMNLQVAQLKNCLGDDVLKALSGFQFATEEANRTVKEILDALEEYVVGQVNETLERYKFGRRCQGEGEPFSNFLSELRRMMKTCGYCQECEPSILRDRIVLGITSDAVKEELLKEKKLTLDQCISICKAGEAAYEHKTSLAPDSVHKIKSSRKKPITGRCKFCGTEHVFKKNKCPAWGKTCSRCMEENHFEACCRKKKKGKMSSKKWEVKKRNAKLHQLEDETEDETSTDTDIDNDSEAWVNNIHKLGGGNDIKCRMQIGKHEVVFQVDTGASVNMLPEKVVKSSVDLQPTDKIIKMWDGSTVDTIGKCRRTVKNPKSGKKYNVEFIVYRGKCQPLLGLNASRQMELITVEEDKFERVSMVSTEKFPEVFGEDIGTLSGTVTLRLKPEAQPIIMPSRRVSINLRPKLEKELDRMVKMGVIEPVTQPTQWLSQLVIAEKKDGGIRVCIDPHELNKVLLRPHYTMPILEEVLHELGNSSVFTKADLRNGYWHVVLDEQSSLMTTFQTPFGRYKFKRLPFGLSSSAEIFEQKLIQELHDLPGVIVVADDVIIHGKSQEDHDANMDRFLQRCKEKKIKLNRKKLEEGRNTITFMGHRISSKGLETDPAKVEAINKMVAPQNITELRRFMGMTNYLAAFLPKLSTVLQPLHNLLKKDVPFHWDDAQDQAFSKVKKMISNSPVLAFYDPKKPLEVENDASEYGLGAVLMQEGRPVAYASRTLTETEKCYAQIEKEMLAAVYGLEKFHHYTYGRKVTVITDHKPLISITRKPLSKAPRRLQNLLLRAKTYNYSLVYRPGTEIPTADTLSRAPTGKPTMEEIIRNIHDYPLKDPLMQRVQAETALDTTLLALGEVILKGWPDNRKQVPESLLPYYPHRDELTVSDGVIMRGERVCIPHKLQNTMKKKVHTGHLGVNACLRLAKEVMFWPRMSSEIRQYIEACGTCATYSEKQTKETTVITAIPNKPWEKIAADLFAWAGKDYLVTYDYHSNFIEVDELSNTCSAEVIKKLKPHLARNGAPKLMITDNGPQFTSSEFKILAQEWNFTHQTISPGNSQSNGGAEAAVKIVKRLFRKCKISGDDPFIGLLNYFNTPTEGLQTSPAQRFLGRKTKSLLPTSDQSLTPETSIDHKKEQFLKEAKRQKSTPKGKDLPPLHKGDTIRMQPIDGRREWQEGKVLQPVSSRSYIVEVEGKTFRRNRRHLRAKATAEHSIPPNTTNYSRRKVSSTPLKSPSAVMEHSKPPNTTTHATEEHSIPPITTKHSRRKVNSTSPKSPSAAMEHHKSPNTPTHGKRRTDSVPPGSPTTSMLEPTNNDTAPETLSIEDTTPKSPSSRKSTTSSTQSPKPAFGSTKEPFKTRSGRLSKPNPKYQDN